MNISCQNLFNELSFQTEHVVENEISKLELLTRSAFTNESFKIMFRFYGSNPIVTLVISDTEIFNITYDKTSGIATTDVLPGKAEGVYWVVITVSNSVSSSTTRRKFEVGRPIKEPKFSIQFVEDEFALGSYIEYKIDMDQGSNVNLQVFFGDEADIEVPTIDVQIKGPWKPYIFNHTQKIAGYFDVIVLVTNAYSSFTLKKNMTITTGTSGLIPKVKNDPVVYTPLGAVAVFQFSYGALQSGANALIKFWPGELIFFL